MCLSELPIVVRGFLDCGKDRGRLLSGLSNSIRPYVIGADSRSENSATDLLNPDSCVARPMGSRGRCLVKRLAGPRSTGKNLAEPHADPDQRSSGVGFDQVVKTETKVGTSNPAASELSSPVSNSPGSPGLKVPGREEKLTDPRFQNTQAEGSGA